MAAVTTALGLFVLASGTALADTELNDTGKVGAHSLNDDPGMTCSYDGVDFNLTSFDIKAPNVYARNTTGGVDSGKVGWRFIIKRQPQGGVATEFYKSPVYKATAKDNQPAAFADKHVAPVIPDDGYPPGSAYTAVVKMFWYRADGAKIGTATHEVDSYVESQEGGDSFAVSECYWRFL